MSKYLMLTTALLILSLCSTLGWAAPAGLDRPLPHKAAIEAASMNIDANRAGAPTGCPQVLTEIPAGGSSGQSKFSGDVLVLNEDSKEGVPDMVATASGHLYLVTAGVFDNLLFVYRSTDGGQTWSWFTGLNGNGTDIESPAIAVPEITEDYIYVIYRWGSVIQVYRRDIATGAYAFFTVDSNTQGIYRPRICTDNHDYPGNYWLYVTYVEWDLIDGTFQVMTARSADQAATWGSFSNVGGHDAVNPLITPDIAFGGGNLYVTWDEVDQYNYDWNVFVRRSRDLGNLWDSTVELTMSTSKDCFDPRVAAIQDGDEVVVAYTFVYSISDHDIYFAYSTDAGGIWNTGLALATTTGVEEKADVSVSPSLGEFHVAYGSDSDIIYRHAAYTNPGSWSAPQTVNDTSQADFNNTPPSVAVDHASGEAGVAWADLRDYTGSIYFDRADWGMSQPPAPDIKANGSDGPVTVTTSGFVTVTIALDPGDQNGDPADWWIFCTRNQTATWWYRYNGGIPKWTKSSTPLRCAGVGLRTLNNFTVLGPRTLPVGDYVFSFAVDEPNGSYEGTHLDSVEVFVN